MVEAARSRCDTPLVLSVAFPYAPIGPKAVGGAEVVCSTVEAALPGMGFSSAVVAHAASEPEGRLYATSIPPGLITEHVRAEVERRHQANIDRAMTENRVALVHMHGLDFHRYRIPAGIPVLVTLHLPPGWYPESIWSLADQYRLVCVSEPQRQACPPWVQRRLEVVENGVFLPQAATLRGEGRYALMLARICAEKNLHVGFEAARQAGMPVLLGGDVFPYEAHERYFAEQIQPRLTGTGGHEGRGADGHEVPERPSARFLGPVTGEEKQRLLRRAACLLLPSLAPETSSLVAMEALAAGVPVIGMAVGAVPTIVENGQTGFVIEPGEGATEAMAEAIRRLPTLDRGQCRAEAEARFSSVQMIRGYARIYDQIHADQITAAAPRGPAGDTATEGETGSSPETKAEADATALVVDELREGAALAELAGEWAELWSADAKATPFQHPAWLLPWWRQFGPDGELRAVTLRDDAARLAGFLPLYTYRASIGADRQLLLVGAGTTDYLDGVWAPWAPGAALRGLAYARREMDGWEVASLQQVRGASALYGAAEELSLPLREAEPCSVLEIAAGVPAKVRVNGNRYRRMAERRGELCCDLVQEPAEALVAFEALAGFHGERWRDRGEAGVLHDPRVLAHHHESLPALLSAGLLRLFRLTLGGETIGVLYGLADGPQVPERRLYLYLIGFEREAAALSPGGLLLQGAWDYASAHGFFKLDLLRGGEAYKRLWGARTETTFALGFSPEAG